MSWTYRGSERPSKWASGVALVTMSCLILSAIAALVARDPFVFVIGFMITWVLAAIGIFLYHLANAFGGGVAHTEHSGRVDTASDAPATRAERLEELKSLHATGLITAEEYAAKKQEVLDRI